MTTRNPYDQYDRRFISELTKLEASRSPSDPYSGRSRAMPPGQARATMASLRRALGKPAGQTAAAYPFVIPLLPPRDPSRDVEADELNEIIYYIVASLFAFHPHNWLAGNSPHWETNFGASIAELKNKLSERSAGIERRLVGLLNAPFSELEEHLRHVISLLKSGDVPVDWLQLLSDLRNWEFDDRAVQRGWARAFWNEGLSASPDSDEASAVSNNDDES